MMDVASIGSGAMDRPMATNLVAAGHVVKAWNRSGEALDGVTMVSTPAEAFQQ